ncbi:hypothetical protein C8R42DRAFT_646952 [Lentinula raphanica]|nr:hypothetical protein C8R42DRAFT_646952 [Lentinula raphanica]
MTKRPRRVLRTMYASRRARPTSLADGPGFLYVFIDNGNKWKTKSGVEQGVSVSELSMDEARRGQTKAQSGWLIVASEALAHILLELACFDRPYDYCPHCRKTHREVFIFNGNQANVWNSIVVGWIAISTNIIH